VTNPLALVGVIVAAAHVAPPSVDCCQVLVAFQFPLCIDWNCRTRTVTVPE